MDNKKISLIWFIGMMVLAIINCVCTFFMQDTLWRILSIISIALSSFVTGLWFCSAFDD